MSAYSYDRSRVADDATAAKKAPSQKPAIPYQERDEVIKHLSECYWIMKEWGIRAGLAQPHSTDTGPPMWVSTPQQHKATVDVIDELHKLQEKIRHL